MNDKPFSSSARVYDMLYEAVGKDYRAEAEQLHSLIQARCPGARSLLDVACGTGAHLLHLCPQYDVVGVDLAAAMLTEARRRMPDVQLVEADMRGFDLGRSFDAITCLFSAIGYMRTTDELDGAIGMMDRHLSPGGVMVIDGWVRAQSWRDPGGVNAVSTMKDGVVASRMIHAWREGNRTTLDLHHLVGSIDGVDYIVESHELTLFTEDEYRGAFARADLDLEVTTSPYPDRDRYVATKPL